MRVLVPLPFDISCQAHGRNLRVVNLLRELSGGCAVTLAACDARVATGAAGVLPGMEVLTAPDVPHRNNARSATLHGPWWLRRAAEFFGYDPALHAWIDRLSADVNVVLGFDLVSALYLTQLGHHAARQVPTVCDLIDDPWLTFRSGRWDEQFSSVGVKTAIAVRALRKLLLPQIHVLTAVAPRDAELLSRTTGRDVRVVPNGVNCPAEPDPTGRREPLIVLTGAMSFPPNEQAARYLVRVIWPRVRRMVPTAQLALVGADPTVRVRQLANEPNVTVTGRVQDLNTWLRRARAATAPLLSGTGLKNKILEACGQACPVVATSLAVGGIPAGEDNGILVADHPVAFAEHLVHLLVEPGYAEELGRAAALMVKEQFSWSGAAQAMSTVLQSCQREQATPTETNSAHRPGREVAHATA
jgi:glycosyltransferase involved in cell wall biosynthesis